MNRSDKQQIRCLLPGLLIGFGLALLPTRSARAQLDQDAINTAVERGVASLRKDLLGTGQRETFSASGQSVLAAYAMLKGGAKREDRAVAGVLGALLKRFKGGNYKKDSHSIYGAGCELMLLEAARKKGKPDQYRKEMQMVVDFIVDNQATDGYWNYLGGDPHGDTSVTQYAVLGLWAAERAGIEVPRQTFEKAAAWLIANQGRTGGFHYRPQRERRGETLSMTVAGTSTLLVALRYLYPNHSLKMKKQPSKKKTGGIVEVVDLDTVVTKDKQGRKIVKTTYKSSIPLSRILGAARLGLGWIAARYAPQNEEWPLYTLYGVERLAALANTPTFGTHNWYAEGAAYLLKNQANDGSWRGKRAGMVSTSFAVLFLTRATAKILGNAPPSFLGDGLLRGGIGLPTDLSTIEENKGGKIKKRKPIGPIDDLLAELQKPKNLDVPEIQEQIVEKIQLGDRKQWLKPQRRKQLRSMAEHKDPEVRKVAIWALGRTGNIDVVPIVLDALENDPDLDVAVEARNALCWLSRKPKGFGLPETPTDGLSPADAEEKKMQLIRQWRANAVKQWKAWYLKVRPYQERDDLQEIGGGR